MAAAGAAVGLFYLLARQLTGHRPTALAATTMLAVSPVWWSQATIAEVYALHGLLVLLFLHCLLRWEEGIEQRGAVADRWLVAACLAAVPSSNGPATAAVCVVTKQTSVIQVTQRRIVASYPLIRFRKVSAGGRMSLPGFRMRSTCRPKPRSP